MELKKSTAESKTGSGPPPAAKDLVFPGCGVPLLLLTSAFRRTPLLGGGSFGLSNNPNEQLACAFRDLQSSVASNADRVIGFLNLCAAENPLLRQLSVLSAKFHGFRQIRCRDNLRMNNLSRHNFAAVLPGDSVAGVVVANGVLNFLNIYNILLTVRLVLTWFPSTPPAIVSPLSSLCDPYLNIFRGIIPPLGGLDLSPVLAFIALNAFSNVAAALPAELPSEECPSQVRIKGQAVSQKCRKPLLANRSKSTPEIGHPN